MQSLFLAMTNFRTHTTFLPTYFTATFSGPFCSHLSNLLKCVVLLVCDGVLAESQILRDVANLYQPKNIKIGTDGSNWRTNLPLLPRWAKKTDYKTLENRFTSIAGGCNNGQLPNAITEVLTLCLPKSLSPSTASIPSCWASTATRRSKHRRLMAWR